MKIAIKILIIVSLIQCVYVNAAFSQNGKGIYDTILTYSKIIGEDTFPMVYLNEVVETGKMSASRAEYLRRLRYNVYKVYPYAIESARIIHDIDAQLAKLDSDRARKKYLKSREKELKEKFKAPLKDLTTTQGKILVKLINRQTGKNVYGMLKDYKSGFKARISQTAAHFFDNDLKATYDPYNEDRDIENIVLEIEKRTVLN